MNSSKKLLIGVLLFSLLLHFSIIAFVHFEKPQPRPPTHEITGVLAPKPAEGVGEMAYEQSLLEKRLEQTRDRQPEPKIPDKGEPCRGEEYRGVGFSFNHGSMLIYDVPKGYAAQLAGVRVGDRILGDEAPLGDKPMNHYDVIRDGHRISFNLPSEMICKAS